MTRCLTILFFAISFFVLHTPSQAIAGRITPKQAELSDDCTASGNYSTAMGATTTASGDYSTAMGALTSAQRYYSTAMGVLTTASGVASTSIGYETRAFSAFETVIGCFSTSYSPTSTNSWEAGDRLFVIGNGTTGSARSDAMVVLKNGNVGIGTAQPVEELEIRYTAPSLRVAADNANQSSLQLYEITNGNPYGYEFQYNGSVDKLYLWSRGYSGNEGVRVTFQKNGNVGIGTTTPSSKLEVNEGDIRVTGGSFIDDGTTLNAPDYVFEQEYEVEPIEAHAEFMWREKHLPAVRSAVEIKSGKGYNMAQRREQILEELEKAHIYIEQLHRRNKALEEKHIALEERLASLEAFINKTMNAKTGRK